MKPARTPTAAASVAVAAFAAAVADAGAGGPPSGTDGRAAATDEAAVRARYEAMFRAMVAKDMAAMDELHADSFVLVHMTGQRMDKREYLDAVRDGTLNYHTADHDSLDVAVDGDRATLAARSRVTASVFGGGRHTWRLRQDMTLERSGGVWRFTSSKASTY